CCVLGRKSDLRIVGDQGPPPGVLRVLPEFLEDEAAVLALEDVHAARAVGIVHARDHFHRRFSGSIEAGRVLARLPSPTMPWLRGAVHRWRTAAGRDATAVVSVE